MGLIDYIAYKNALEQLYEDTVTAYVTVTTQNPKTKVMEKTKKVVIENAPCLLSFNSESHKDNTTGYVDLKRQDVITTGLDVIIPPGSEVHVTRQTGDVYKYKFSDIPSIHQSHRRYSLSKEGVE